MNGDTDRVRQLLRSGADPNYVQTVPFLGTKVNALYYAFARPGNEMLRLLLEHGANPNFQAEHLALDLACAEGNVEGAMLLLRHGASVHTRDADGWTPLMLAVGLVPDVELVKELLSRGADPNAAANDGWSVLMSAAKTGDPEVIRLLLQHHADPNARAKNGSSPLSVAVASGRQSTVALLKAAGAR
jgi:ankyrin repeat protein